MFFGAGTPAGASDMSLSETVMPYIWMLMIMTLLGLVIVLVF
ncbi:MAG: hypothetical protein QNJ92_02640 [Alphaproteobacteria bacterium]|nr:hypothetical protein [Alphaproteobacteria bacterium]